MDFNGILFDKDKNQKAGLMGDYMNLFGSMRIIWEKAQRGVECGGLSVGAALMCATECTDLNEIDFHDVCSLEYLVMINEFLFPVRSKVSNIWFARQ